MPEDRMENSTPPSPESPSRSGLGKGTAAPRPDTQMHEDTAHEELDPNWEQLGSTRITESDASSSGVGLDTSANFTEFTPSRVLGKNLVNLGDFKLVKKLGEGAMGAVYKATQVTFNGEKLDKPRTVALKVLFPHVAKIPKLVERLYREGRVMGALSHPNIVQAYAVDEAQGCHYVAMEYVSGQSMQKWLTQLGRLSVGDALRVAIDCAKALQYAHSQNMVHRDIKPDNILLTRRGDVKVADLGMVKIDDEEMALTQTGHAVGTPWFMPLEQARNSKEIDGRSDIYALGCTLYAMLTGRPPFMGRTIVEVIQLKEIGTFPPARQTNVNVPERLDLVLVKMTSKLPKNRYQTCAEVIKDMESLGLANETLSFVHQPMPEHQVQDTPAPGKTTVVPALAKAAVEAEEPALDPDQWYVQLKMSDGTTVTRHYTTAQLQKMLAEGTMKPTARASHNPDDGFRSLGTYKEFQGTALAQLSKKAADKQGGKVRGIYKKLEAEEAERIQQEFADKKEQSAVEANTRYWVGIALKGLPILLGVVLIVLIFLFLKWLF